MPIESASQWLCVLLGVSLLQQTAEYWKIASWPETRAVFWWPTQQRDVAHTWPWLQKFLAWMYSQRVHQAHLLVRAVLAASLMVQPTIFSSVVLFLGTVILLIRWRGAFNGGSDFMTLVALTGLLIASLSEPWIGATFAWKAALWYVTLHAMTSYFVSGAVKLLSMKWRNGQALTYFLDGGLYGPLPAGSWLRSRPVAVLSSWAFIVWEISFPLALISPQWAWSYCAIALCFHLLVFRFFGLNRFVWAWAVAFPAIVYAASQW